MRLNKYLNLIVYIYIHHNEAEGLGDMLNIHTYVLGLASDEETGAEADE